MNIERTSLQAFFLPFLLAGPNAETRVHIWYDQSKSRHGAGYVSGLDEAAVEKYCDGSNTTDRIAFADITAVAVTDHNGCVFKKMGVV